jgi:hypothetical protein
MKGSTKSSSWQSVGAAGKQAVMQKKEVDGAGDKPHNLTSSLLMNTTLHHQAAGSTEQVL